MGSEEVFEKMQEELSSAPRPWESEDWFREGIRKAQEKIVKEYFENKIADPE